MDSKIFINNRLEILITSRIEYWIEKIKLGIFPEQNYLQIDNIDELNNYNVKTISFDKVTGRDINSAFEYLKHIHDFELIAFHECKSKETIKCYNNNIVIGEKCNLPIIIECLETIEEITFLSLKTFKGNIDISKTNVKKLVIWNDKENLNEFLINFNQIEALTIYNSNISFLQLKNFKNIVSLEVYNCKKLEYIYMDEGKIIDIKLIGTPLFKKL